MSWDAWLTDDRGHREGDFNYTQNTSVMIYDALDALGIDLAPSTHPCKWLDRETGEWHDAPNGHGTVSWWEHLDGMSGPDGAAFLHAIIGALRANPAKYQPMNPENGWGNYDGLVKILTAMRDAVPEWPCTWSASG